MLGISRSPLSKLIEESDTKIVGKKELSYVSS